jgi:hypothetical protein
MQSGRSESPSQHDADESGSPQTPQIRSGAWVAVDMAREATGKPPRPSSPAGGEPRVLRRAGAAAPASAEPLVERGPAPEARAPYQRVRTR